MRHSKGVFGLLATAVVAACALPAGATEWTFPTTNTNVTVTDCGGGATSCKYGFSSNTGGLALKVHAFSTANNTSPNSNPPGTWKTANLQNYGGDFGITNLVGDAGEGTSPEHAVDNDGAYDIMVFELPTGMTWDIEAFRLGWASESGNMVSADVQTWIGGGQAAIDFTQVCFTGCAAPLVSGTGNLGFKDITSAMQGVTYNGLNGPGDNNVPEGQTISFAGTQSGRYLVMSGKLGDSKDSFKPEYLKAFGTPTQTPLPGTLALLGLGLAGLVAARRRPARA
jgi:hypothetical protein